jgi:hypothetical protein
MDNLQSEIEERINTMVGDLLVVVRRAAIEAVNNALSGTPGAVGRATVTRPPSSRGRKRTLAPRRSAEELSHLREQLYAEIVKSPGERMVYYASKLGMPTKPLSLLREQLLKSGQVRKVGQRDKMRYFPMDKA